MYEYVPKDIYASLRSPALALTRRVLIFLTIAIPFTMLWYLLPYDRRPYSLSAGPARITKNTYWHGWAQVENVIVLYATTV